MTVSPPTTGFDSRFGAMRRLTDLQTFGLVMAAGALALPHLPEPGILCPLRRFTGIPCPLCGSTTAVLHLSQGNVLDAVRANPAAVVLALCCAGAFLPAAWRRWLSQRVDVLRRAVTARWPRPLGGKARTVVSVVVLLALWAYQLHRFAKW